MPAHSNDVSRLTLDNLGVSDSERAVLVSFVDSWEEHGYPVLFVGAGMSTYNAEPRGKLKDWRGLIQDLREELYAGHSDKPGSGETVDYLRTAQLHETQFQRSRLLDAVARALPVREVRPGAAHRALLGIPWQAVITTNYDDLIERTFESTKPVVKIVSDADLTRHRSPDSLLVVKMHGDLADRDGIVLTEEDYRCYGLNRPGIELKVKQLLLEHPALFIGFSLADPNFVHIEGWIRDTTGRLRVQAVALVHTKPLEAEREMWGKRGVRLVQVPLGESLERYFAAIRGHRDSKSRPPGVNSAVPTDSAVGERLRSLVRERPEGWRTSFVRHLGDLLGEERSDMGTILRHVLFADFSALPAAELEGVLKEMPPALRRKLFLSAYASGIRSATGIGPGAGKVNVVDIESELFDDSGLSPDERASVLLRRAEGFAETADLKRACQDLLSARDQAHDDVLRGRIQASLRKILLRLGDDTLIEQHLLNVPLPEDAFAYCRRGADALLSHGRNAAAGWYSEARNLARTGDEKIAAIMGLQATEDPSDWSRLGELDRERLAIPKEDRPKTQQVWSLRSDAGSELLRLARAGAMRQPFDSQAAVRKLREALDLADEMGWPKCPAANFSTAGWRVPGSSVS